MNKVAPSQLVGRTGTWRNVSFEFDTGSIEFGAARAAASIEPSREGRAREPASTAPVGVSSWLAAYGLTADSRTIEGGGPRARRGRA
jgi:hypothetical protein